MPGQWYESAESCLQSDSVSLKVLAVHWQIKLECQAQQKPQWSIITSVIPETLWQQQQRRSLRPDSQTKTQWGAKRNDIKSVSQSETVNANERLHTSQTPIQNLWLIYEFGQCAFLVTYCVNFFFFLPEDPSVFFQSRHMLIVISQQWKERFGFWKVHHYSVKWCYWHQVGFLKTTWRAKISVCAGMRNAVALFSVSLFNKCVWTFSLILLCICREVLFHVTAHMYGMFLCMRWVYSTRTPGRFQETHIMPIDSYRCQ